MIDLKTFAAQYLPEPEQAAAIASLRDHASQQRPLEEWRQLWRRALVTPVQ